MRGANAIAARTRSQPGAHEVFHPGVANRAQTLQTGQCLGVRDVVEAGDDVGFNHPLGQAGRVPAVDGAACRIDRAPAPVGVAGIVHRIISNRRNALAKRRLHDAVFNAGDAQHARGAAGARQIHTAVGRDRVGTGPQPPVQRVDPGGRMHQILLAAGAIGTGTPAIAPDPLPGQIEAARVGKLFEVHGATP